MDTHTDVQPLSSLSSTTTTTAPTNTKTGTSALPSTAVHTGLGSTATTATTINAGTATTAAATAAGSGATAVSLYKGKVTRSWPQLPDELVRHIATFYLWDASSSGFCPQIWDTRELWHHRMVYTSIRDALLLEKNLMPICPQWSKALESHNFWLHATALIDPLDALAHHAIIHPPKPPPSSDTNRSSTTTSGTTRAGAQSQAQTQVQPTRLTPYCHYRSLLTYSCHICRVNQPNNSAGLTAAKRLSPSPLLGSLTLCKEHDRRRSSFCGICMREAPLFEGNTLPPSYAAAGITPNAAIAAAQAYNNMSSLEGVVSCLENEDEDTWPGVTATCRFCRREWLWRKAASNPRDREAIGGSKMSSEDWETRQCVDGFIDLAEGSINDVIGLAREKWWLRKYTKLGDMMLQALAAARFTSASVAPSSRRGHDDGAMFVSELVEEEEEEEEEEEDPELMQLTEEGGVRELALGDWARSRILDGHWFSPADLWYRNVVPGKPIAVRAVHPCPWAREEYESDAGDPDGSGSAGNGGEEIEHPRPATVNAETPPSYGLCEQAYVAHQRQMRVVLLSPMRNIVRRLVMECSEDAKTGIKGDCTWGGSSDDPALRATKLSLEEVLQILREEEGVWFDGVDWMERRRNSKLASEPSPTSTTGSDKSLESARSASGASSSATSPVLSTSTLQTTPSPPPVSSSSLDLTPREGVCVDGDCPEVAMANEALLNAASDSRDPELGGTRPPAPALPPRPPARLITIAVSPVLNPPKLLRPIPYVPVTLLHLPQYSVEAFRAVWREACAPLYHCRCKICERAMATANADATGNVRANGSVPVSSTQVADIQAKRTPTAADLNRHQQPVEIRLDGAVEVDGEGEEELQDVDAYVLEEAVEYDLSEEEGQDGDEYLEVSSTFGEYGEERESYSPSSFSRTATTPERDVAILPGREDDDPVGDQEDPLDDPSEDVSDLSRGSNASVRLRQQQHRRPRAVSNSDDDDYPCSQRSRKRSCDELEDEESGAQSAQPPELRRKKEGTPPKKARKNEPDSPVSPSSTLVKMVGHDRRRGSSGAGPGVPLVLGGERTVAVRMRKRSSEELEEDHDAEDRDERTWTRRESRNRNGSDVSRGSRGSVVSKGSRASRGSHRGAGSSSSDRERGEKTAPHKRLKVGEGGDEGMITRGSDRSSSVSSPPTTTTTISE